jgi:hypothetical protein
MKQMPLFVAASEDEEPRKHTWVEHPEMSTRADYNVPRV